MPRTDNWLFCLNLLALVCRLLLCCSHSLTLLCALCSRATPQQHTGGVDDVALRPQSLSVFVLLPPRHATRTENRRRRKKCERHSRLEKDADATTHRTTGGLCVVMVMAVYIVDDTAATTVRNAIARCCCLLAQTLCEWDVVVGLYGKEWMDGGEGGWATQCIRRCVLCICFVTAIYAVLYLMYDAIYIHILCFVVCVWKDRLTRNEPTKKSV